MTNRRVVPIKTPSLAVISDPSFMRKKLLVELSSTRSPEVHKISKTFFLFLRFDLNGEDIVQCLSFR